MRNCSQSRRSLGVGLLFLASLASGCEEWQRYRDSVAMFDEVEQAFVAVPGEPASRYLEPVTSEQKADVDATLDALALADGGQAVSLTDGSGLTTADEGAPATVSVAAAEVLTAAQKAKESFASTGFKRDEATFFSRAAPGFTLRPAPEFSLLADTVTWTSNKTRFTISTLDRMPVRDQGQRGTCAAHAGVGQLEGLILKKYPEISGINLSEQRFYYMAKPDHWATGGAVDQEGSEAGSAFASSKGFDWTQYDASWTYPADWVAGLNIPLESDCPYNPAPGANDLQIPQADGCRTGVLKVTDYAAWIEGADRDLRTPQEIYDFLLTQDYPVVTATKLSGNWEDNDGMITLAAAGQPSSTSHAAGHAYLIVGARQLEEAEFPDEGGMCFIIKNSWGPGWGVNGLSCMTLAWFNAWRFKDATFGLAFDVEMDAAKVQAAKDGEDQVPDGIAEPDGNALDESYGLKKRRGKAHVNNLVAPVMGLAASDFSVGELFAGDGQTYKILYRVDGETLTVRGVLKGQAKMTENLTLSLKDGTRVEAGTDDGEAVQYGTLDPAAKRLVLCGQTFASVCDLNYVEAKNALAVGLTEGEALKEDPEGPFNWKSLAFGGYAVEVSVPTDALGRVDLRFKVNDAYTNAQRFAVDPLGGAITWHGKQIGDYQSGEVCSGSFAALCRIVVAGDQFHVFSKAQKK